MLIYWRSRLLELYRFHHPTIWLLTVGRLFNAVMQFMSMPFLTMYLRANGVSLAVIGVVLALGPLGSALGNLVGGQLADHWGRKPAMVLGMALGGAATAGFAVAQHTWQFAALYVCQGVFGALTGPAFQSALADLSPLDRRNSAFALSRVTNNMGTAVGPLLGTLVSARGPLFAVTGLADMVFALVFLWLGVESVPAEVKAQRPAARQGDRAAQWRQAAREWRQLATDKALVFFTLAGLVSTIAYSQMFTTYSLYIKNFSVHPDKTFAWMISLNGLMVVCLQMPVTHLIRRWSTGLTLVAGSLLFALGYALFGIPGSDLFVLGACMVWTVGEMVISPSQMIFVADIAPEALRGRYMGASSIAGTLGSTLAGLIGAYLLNQFGGGIMMLVMAGLAAASALVYQRAAAAAERPTVACSAAQ